jgi:hypothetical protein
MSWEVVRTLRAATKVGVRLTYDAVILSQISVHSSSNECTMQMSFKRIGVSQGCSTEVSKMCCRCAKECEEMCAHVPEIPSTRTFFALCHMLVPSTLATGSEVAQAHAAANERTRFPDSRSHKCRERQERGRVK